jgi:acyl-CoA synthetase (NDP forming)
MMSTSSNDSNSIEKLFTARSIAIVGASTNPEKLGYQILSNLLRGGYTGSVFPVNPRAEELLGKKVYASILDIPENIDLVVMVIPADFVPQGLREAVEKRCRSAIIISGGFREAGRADLESDLLDIVSSTGLRIVGPNCQGINFLANQQCTSWPLVKASGPLAVISQSGTVAATLAGWAVDEGFGISATVSLGNQIDVCESDLLEFFHKDESTKSIAMYLEGARDGRRFLRVAEAVSSQKPIALLKSGMTPGGQRAAASHTRSLAGSDRIFDAACRQFGIRRVYNLESLYDAAKGMGTLTGIKGNRIFIITSSGGSGIIAVDEAERNGIEVLPLPPDVVGMLKQTHISPNATFSNPLDLTVAPSSHYSEALDIISSEEIVDMYLVIFGDPIPGATEVVSQLVQKVGKCVAVAYLGGGEVEKEERTKMHHSGIPVFPTPERAIQGMKSALWMHEVQMRKLDT